MRRRRLAFLALVLVVSAIGGLIRALAELPIPDAVGNEATTVLLDRRGVPIAQLHAEQHRLPLTLDEVSPILVDAVIASEDQDFFSHPGVDPAAIGRAAWTDIRGVGEMQGASTITQQYVKNAYLGADRTLVRKLREAVLAVKIERELSKVDILERYLNVIYLGRGAYGVEAASQVWFGLSAVDLDVPRAAYLAALIRAPELADVSRPEQVDLAYRRRLSVLNAMWGQGRITSGERDAAEATPIESYTLSRTENRSVDLLVPDVGLGYFVDMVRRELIATYGSQQVFSGGLRVVTTLDLDAQRAAYELGSVVTDVEDAPAVAMILLDDQGQVRALIGGTDFDVSEVNLVTGREGGGGGRQPGSAFKPLVLAAALRQGISIDAVYDSPASIVVPGADAGQDWSVANANGVDRGMISLADATVVSSNTAYAGLALDLDLGDLVRLGSEFGIAPELDPLFSLVLGAQELSVLDLATAYSVFANEGELRQTSIVIEVDLGEAVDNGVISRSQVLDGNLAAQVTEVLERVVAEGTGRGADVAGLPIAGKTGTSQDFRDAWFVGYSPRFTAAVWLGYADDGRPMVDVLGLGAVTGGSVPAALFSQLMEDVHHGLDPGAFMAPVSGDE